MWVPRNLADRAARDSHESGWTGVLAKLIAALGGGIGQGRNRIRQGSRTVWPEPLRRAGRWD